MLVGMGIFFGAILASRILNERAMVQLEDAQKLALFDAFTGQRKYQLIPLVVLVLLYLGVSQAMAGSTVVVTAVFWLGLVAYATVAMVLNVSRMRGLDLPSSYLRSWITGRALVTTGVIAMIAGFFLAGVR